MLRCSRSVGWLLVLAAILGGCGRAAGTLPEPNPDEFATPPASTSKPPASSSQNNLTPDKRPKESGPAPAPKPSAKPTTVRFRLFSGPAGFRLPEKARDLSAGETVVVGTGPLALDVLLPGLSEQAARQAVKVEGGVLEGESTWAGETLGLTIGAGKAGEKVRVSVQPPGGTAAFLTLARAAQATVTVDYRFDTSWRPVTLLDTHLPKGPAEIRLMFSKPVRRAEVEKALQQGQSALVRGLMQWQDDRTMVWIIAEMPPRLDVLLGGAYDQDGLPLPGGVPSLRVGEPPVLVELNPTAPADKPVGPVLPDVAGASISKDGKFVNLLAWTPGTSPWDWQTSDFNLELQTLVLKPGRVGEGVPRPAAGLQNWVVNPQGTLLAGLRPGRDPGMSDLVVADPAGGRQQVYPAFTSAPAALGSLAWSGDGTRVVALSASKEAAGKTEVVSLALPGGLRSVLAADLAVPPTARVAWSAGGRYLLAGNTVLDLQEKLSLTLPGDPATARGAWEPGGDRLLYSARDWDQLLFFDAATGSTLPTGTGFLVGWAGRSRAYVIRWPASGTRYVPPGG